MGETLLVEREFGEAVPNLVTNACFAMQQKQGELGEEYSPVLNVSSHLVDDLIEVRVRDNGPGIAEDAMDRIFNPFFSTRDGALGAGLRACPSPPTWPADWEATWWRTRCSGSTPSSPRTCRPTSRGMSRWRPRIPLRRRRP